MSDAYPPENYKIRHFFGHWLMHLTIFHVQKITHFTKQRATRRMRCPGAAGPSDSTPWRVDGNEKHPRISWNMLHHLKSWRLSMLRYEVMFNSFWRNIEHMLPKTEWCVVSSFPPFGFNMLDISKQFWKNKCYKKVYRQNPSIESKRVNRRPLAGDHHCDQAFGSAMPLKPNTEQIR